MHLVAYLEEQSRAKTILLLDDIASELDAKHFGELISQIGNRPFFLTGHRIPEVFFEGRSVKTINFDT